MKTTYEPQTPNVMANIPNQTIALPNGPPAAAPIAGNVGLLLPGIMWLHLAKRLSAKWLKKASIAMPMHA
eukprot:CAMPEP_0115352804 /NCGR_PEP_ID=MMETSP0270-20121206/97699_1 /TAXON_ID=71861 /ORGANISM="Scrippsiella trochoidea, Strain CCMP3099" /LENGTH=69 /DNA_ID=CAMNT_0002774997 /DNA_START=231 /DNA_END=436 /DNA_ORIENTATION=-